MNCNSLIAQGKFLDELRRQKSGQGKVTIQHSARIESLVSGVLSANITAGQDVALDQSSDDEFKSRGYELTKINGYRVQVYAGGNSRDAKQAAERTAVTARQHFSNLGVYAQFSNPRWVCRVGNFKTRNEASRALEDIKTVFPDAVIIRCQIILPE